MQTWTVPRVFSACVEYPGLRALVACNRATRYLDALSEVRQLLTADITEQVTPTGSLFTFPHGSELRLVALINAEASRKLTGVLCHLVVFDGLTRDDEAYLATRVRSAEPGPLLGAYPLALDRPVRP